MRATAAPLRRRQSPRAIARAIATAIAINVAPSAARADDSARIAPAHTPIAPAPVDVAALARAGRSHERVGLALLLAGTAVSLASAAVTIEGFARCGSIYGEPCSRSESIAVGALSAVGQSLCIIGVPLYMVGRTELDLAHRLTVAPVVSRGGGTITLAGAF